MIYYWKVQILNKILVVHAHNAKECDELVKAWIKKQGLPEYTVYKKGDSYCVKKNTPPDIVDQEREHLKEYLC